MGDNSQLFNSVHGILFRPWDSSSAKPKLNAKLELEGKEVRKKTISSTTPDHDRAMIRQAKSCAKPMVGSMSSVAIKSTFASNLHLGMSPSSFFSFLGPAAAAAAFNVKSASSMPPSHSSYPSGFKFNELISANVNFHPNATSNNLSFQNIFPYNMSTLSNPSCLAGMMPLPYKNASSLPCGGGSPLLKVSEQSRTMDKQGKKQRPKRFQCPHCQVSFSNNGQLKGHIRIHTGERPFVCDHTNCGKTFTRNEELTRHKRIHTGLRPFACSVCNKRFGRKDHLKKHVKTHQRPPPIAVPLPLNAASLTAYSAAAAAFGYPWL